MANANPTETKQTKPAQPTIAFPLFPGNPCVFYPSGIRAGDPLPAIMLRREGNDHVTLIEICAGANKRHDCVRHVDDPHLHAHPNARRMGAWDYAEGIVYDFDLPKTSKR